MFYMVDNYDSFVYNLAAYMEEAGQKVMVRRADQVKPEEICKLQPEGIILSPGPKRPEDAAESRRVLMEFQNRIPILGVCLGHQLIGQFFGASVCKGSRPVHGKVTRIRHSGKGLFQGLPETYQVTRYHSLIVKEDSLPACLQASARTGDGVIMGLEHRVFPIYSVQFHPEAVLTEYGHELLGNFRSICERWWRLHD